MAPVSVSLGGPALLAAGGASTLTATLPAGVVLGGIAGGAAAGAIASGTVRGATAGALSGGVMAGIGGLYGDSYGLGRLLAEGAASGATAAAQGGSFGDGFVTGAGLSSLTWASLEMRRVMIEQSRIRYDMDEPLYARDNASGISWGFRGDFFKLGGCRHPCRTSPLGGLQGGPGNVFGIAYGPGSFFDRLVETYSGPHDFLNSPLFYDAFGNNVPRPDLLEVINAANVLVATPFAAASVVPGYAYAALGDP
jgi:filamentous hemagglutinin